ncbi:hypothetical protein Tco_1271813 [Tanacetum coccineum]
MKNKVEAQPRKVNKKNRVIEPIHDVDVKHSLLKMNSELNCATCKKSMFDGVHDMCLLDFVENVNSRAKSTKKHKKQNIWKPTGHVFTEVGLKWKPTGRTFTIIGSSKKAKIVESKNANHSKPNHTWGSNAIDIPSSSYLVMIGTVRFVNDHVARIIGYGDYQLINLTISRVYYVEGLGYNLFPDPETQISCALGKRKKTSHQPKAGDTKQEKLYLLHMDLYGPMRVASINGKSSGPKLHSLTHATSSSGLVPNTVSQQPCIPPNKDDWDHLFQEAAAPRAVVVADSLVSTSIDQDAPSRKLSSDELEGV